MTAPRFDHTLSIVLPAHDEEDNIGIAIEKCLDYSKPRFRAVEVVVVDDGSRDATAARIAERAGRHPEVRAIRFERNRGYGAALTAGFEASRHDLVFFTDSDLQFDVREIDDLIPLLANADAVFGYRVNRFDSATRRLLSWTYNRIVSVLFRVQVRDVDCSFKLFTRPVVDRLNLETADFAIDAEMVARTRRMGARIVEKGVRHYPRTHGHTKVRASDIPRTLLALARMWLRIHFPSLARSKRTPRLTEPPTRPNAIAIPPKGSS
jgi:glycosyltransferase involved in cell wall biosynthesis